MFISFIVVYIYTFSSFKINTVHNIDFFPNSHNRRSRGFYYIFIIYSFAHNIMIACSAGKYRKIIKDIDDYMTLLPDYTN